MKGTEKSVPFFRGKPSWSRGDGIGGVGFKPPAIENTYDIKGANMSRAWSTIRKTANERGMYARQTECNGRPCFILLDSNLQVRLCTNKAAELEAAVYGL